MPKYIRMPVLRRACVDNAHEHIRLASRKSSGQTQRHVRTYTNEHRNTQMCASFPGLARHTGSGQTQTHVRTYVYKRAQTHTNVRKLPWPGKAHKLEGDASMQAHKLGEDARLNSDEKLARRASCQKPLLLNWCQEASRQLGASHQLMSGRHQLTSGPWPSPWHSSSLPWTSPGELSKGRGKRAGEQEQKKGRRANEKVRETSLEQ